MQGRPPSVADQTSFGSKHSDEDGDDLKEKEFVTVIMIGSETTQSEVPGLSGIIVIKTERSTLSYSFLSMSSALIFSIFTLHSSPLLAACCPNPVFLLLLSHLSPAPSPVSLAYPPPAPLLPYSPILPCSPLLSCSSAPSPVPLILSFLSYPSI